MNSVNSFRKSFIAADFVVFSFPMTKRKLYLLGLITLLAFPIPTFLGLYFAEGILPLEILDLDNFLWWPMLMGLLLGTGYAGVALLAMQARVFDKLPVRIENIVRQMKLSVLDCIFLSFCAGFGEELLFRSGVQFYLGPIITSVVFVAIHGYLNPFHWRMSIYGLIVLPFILILSYGFETQGLWFAIVAHFAYDLVLFLVITKTNDEQFEDGWSAEHTYMGEAPWSDQSQSTQTDEDHTSLPEHPEGSRHSPDVTPEVDEDSQ